MKFLSNMANYKSDRRGGFYFHPETNKPYVTVTTVLQVIDKPALRYWYGQQVYRAMVADPSLDERGALAAPYQISDKAKSRGTTVHSIVEAYKAMGEPMEVAEEFKGYAESFYKWIGDMNVEITDKEKTLFCQEHRFAGTYDIVAKVNGQEMLIDVKTGKDIYPEAFIQLSAYKYALEESGRKIDRTAVILLGEDGKYKFGEGRDMMDQFLACQTIWKGLNQELCEKVGY